MNQSPQAFSPGVRDVLDRIPNWYERWGTALVAGIVAGLLALAGAVRYPDVLTAQATVTTQRPPLTLYSRSTGPLTALWPENAPVAAGAWLALVGNAGAPASIRRVQGLVRQAQRQLARPDPDSLRLLRAVASDSLGEVQDEFAAFLLALQAYQYALSAPHFGQREQNAAGQGELLRQLNAQLLRQQRLQAQEFQLTTRQYRRDSALLAGQVIAPAVFEATRANYLRQKSQLATTAVSRQQTDLQRAQLDAARIGSRELYQGGQQVAFARLQETLLRLRSRLAAWELAYVLKAPGAGRLAYLGPWAAGQRVRAGEAVFVLLPPPGALLARATLPVRGAGRVCPGQQVLLRLDDYPAEQFGTVAGTVAAIAPVPTAGHYLLTIRLARGLRTSTGQDLAFRPQLAGTAQVIIQDVSLLDRVFRPMHQLLANRF